jgi:hypothetical protein
MTNKKLDGIQIWKQFEDLIVPGLRLSALERAVYSYLVRHSRLEGSAGAGGQGRAASGGRRTEGTRDFRAAAGRSARSACEKRYTGRGGASDGVDAMPRSHHSARAEGTEWLSQLGFKLHGMQFAEERTAGGGFSAVAVSQRPAGEWRTKRAAAGAGEDGGGEDAAGGGWGKKLSRGTPLRGRGTPAYPARLRSERARNL